MKHAIAIISAIVFCTVFIGCKNQDARRRAVLSAAVEEMRTDWEQQAAHSFRHLENHWYNPRSRDKAVAWLDRATQLKQATANLMAYLDSLRSAVAAGTLSPAQLFDTRQLQTRLYDRVWQYKADVLALIDTSQFYDFEPGYWEKFKREQAMISKSFRVLPSDTLDKDSWGWSSWRVSLLSDKRKDMALRTRQLMQGRLRMFEVDYLDYLSWNAQANWCGYDVWRPVSYISTPVVKAGQPVTTYAGLMITQVDNGIRIHADTIPLLIDHSGWAERKIPVSGAPGKYTLPVHFEYEENGQIHTQTRLLEYFIEP